MTRPIDKGMFVTSIALGSFYFLLVAVAYYYSDNWLVGFVVPFPIAFMSFGAFVASFVSPYGDSSGRHTHRDLSMLAKERMYYNNLEMTRDLAATRRLMEEQVTRDRITHNR